MKHLKTYNENQFIKDHLSGDGKSLDLDKLNLTELPKLPEGLERLDCDNNLLTELPELPKGLERLYCYDNKLPYNDLKGYWKWFWEQNPDLYNANKMGLY